MKSPNPNLWEVRGEARRSVMPNLALNFAGKIWHRIPVEDPFAARFFDRHLMAGWHVVRYVPPGHGRPAKVEIEAPR